LGFEGKSKAASGGVFYRKDTKPARHSFSGGGIAKKDKSQNKIQLTIKNRKFLKVSEQGF